MGSEGHVKKRQAIDEQGVRSVTMWHVSYVTSCEGPGQDRREM